MRVKETIIVEGRDDTAAIKRSVEALTIETHGYGIRPDTWELIAKAYEATGIIVFTDPDHAGEQIRKRILDAFPDVKEAFLDVNDASKDGDIGIENASPQKIREALSKLRSQDTEIKTQENEEFTTDDMFAWRLTGSEGASYRRQMLGKKLGVGFANSKTMLTRLNKFGIKREEIETALTDSSSNR